MNFRLFDNASLPFLPRLTPLLAARVNQWRSQRRSQRGSNSSSARWCRPLLSGVLSPNLRSPTWSQRSYPCGVGVGLSATRSRAFDATLMWRGWKRTNEEWGLILCYCFFQKTLSPALLRRERRSLTGICWRIYVVLHNTSVASVSVTHSPTKGGYLKKKCSIILLQLPIDIFRQMKS